MFFCQLCFLCDIYLLLRPHRLGRFSCFLIFILSFEFLAILWILFFRLYSMKGSDNEFHCARFASWLCVAYNTIEYLKSCFFGKFGRYLLCFCNRSTSEILHGHSHSHDQSIHLGLHKIVFQPSRQLQDIHQDNIT